MYFHGAPGSGHELELFGDARPIDWLCPDRDGADGAAHLAARFAQWARLIDELAKTGPVRLVGFSIGAFVALSAAQRAEARNISLDLVSPACPLQAGDFLDHLAGKQVFSLAQSSPKLFGLMTAIQSAGTRFVPGLMMKAMFGSASGADAGLLADEHFRRAMQSNLTLSLGRHRAAYQAEITAYVQDWRPVLAGVNFPVRLWHGQADNWAVPGMSESLLYALPNVEAIHRLPDLSHYSTLQYFLAQDGAEQPPRLPGTHHTTDA